MGEERLEDASALVLDPHRFSGYELLGEIARGGMGVVFRARQLNPARLVALKVIAAGELASPRMVERFRLEAEAAARLDHPNIVPIFEAGHQAGWHFFSMRLIEGGTLGEAMGAPQSLRPEESSASHGPQGLRRSGPREAAALMVKIARAVQHAHERGVLHRDLKPGNILLDAQGEPHLTDFGLAKMLAGNGDDGMTLSCAVLGTPAYMAPEQAEGGTRSATVAADVYGLGAVLYEMLAGCPPFAAASTAALLRKIAEDEAVAPSQRRRPSGVNCEEQTSGRMPALPGDLDAICLKCLEKEPARRYPTAAALADDLERALRGEPIFAQPSTATQRVRKWVRRHPARSGLIATAALAVVVITLGSLAFSVRVSRGGNDSAWSFVGHSGAEPQSNRVWTAAGSNAPRRFRTRGAPPGSTAAVRSKAVSLLRFATAVQISLGASVCGGIAVQRLENPRTSETHC
jgi:serine/threonine-protein kinase